MKTAKQHMADAYSKIEEHKIADECTDECVMDAMKAYARDVADEVKAQAVKWVIKGAPLSVIKRDIIYINVEDFIK